MAKVLLFVLLYFMFKYIKEHLIDSHHFLLALVGTIVICKYWPEQAIGLMLTWVLLVGSLRQISFYLYTTMEVYIDRNKVVRAQNILIKKILKMEQNEEELKELADWVFTYSDEEEDDK